MEIKSNHKQGTANYTNQNQDRYPIPFDGYRDRKQKEVGYRFCPVKK